MRTVAHVSDLHFGAASASLVDALAECLLQLRPAVIAVSGDLTQRARHPQFRAAKQFLDGLPHPKLVVPGNHDVPLYNVLARFGDPLGRYHRYFGNESDPTYLDPEIAAIGADTTRSFTIKDGGLRRSDVARVTAFLHESRAPVKILVCHHPFDPPSGRAGRMTRPAPFPGAVSTLVENGMDILLTGHLHASRVGPTAIRYQVRGRSALVIEAGTATSYRVRGEENAFNLVRIDGTEVSVEHLAWDPAERRFATTRQQRFIRDDNGWRAASPDDDT
jgi:3',5'-cyclic AMP phosphodiesterase CpdA